METRRPQASTSGFFSLNPQFALLMFKRDRVSRPHEEEALALRRRHLAGHPGSPNASPMCRQIYVGTLLLGFDDVDQRMLPGNGMGQWHAHGLSQEVPEVHLQIRYRFERAQICFLAHWLAWIIRSRSHACREVLYPPDLVCGRDDGKQPGKIKPFVRGVAARAKVEVERIDVEIGKHAYPRKMQEPFLSGRPRALSPKLPGVVSRSLLPPPFSIIKKVLRKSGSVEFRG
jgi:hypothetical protein